MRCCVPDCKNDSRHISKSQGITFHTFPTEPALRTAWLKALGKEAWEPKDRSAVCSEHFLCEDVYETEGGLRRVRVGAVPMILQDSNVCDSYGEPVSLKFCRICLDMDSKLVPLRSYQLEQAFENVTGLSLCTEDRLPQKLCTECVHRLLNCDKFRLKSLRSNALLLEVIRKQNYLTEENIKSINRRNNQLTTNLVTTHFETNHCDFYIEYTEPLPIIEEKQCDIQIKEENEIFLSEEVHEKADLDDAIFEDKEFSDKDFSLDNDNNYSTDDNLPLEVCKTKKAKKRKVKEKKAIKEVKKVKKAKEVVEPKIDRRRKPFLNDDLNETLFTITDLSFEEQIAEIVKRQESSNYKNSVFKCTDCFKGFLDEDAYNSHIVRHTNQCGEHECEICKTHFKHPHALRKHITAHHTQRFSCKQCTYVTTHRQTARLHERWHKGTKYRCPHCQDEFVAIMAHMKQNRRKLGARQYKKYTKVMLKLAMEIVKSKS